MIFYVKTTPCVCIPSLSFGWIGMLPLPVTTDNVTLNNKFKVVVDKYLDIPAGIAIAPSHE
jgi:hypothetical protein